MNNAIVKFTSVTYALKAKEIIEKYGGKAVLRKNNKMTVGEGCGYKLIVNGNINRIINLLDLNRIKYSGYEMIK